jgi:hypothetical protein
MSSKTEKNREMKRVSPGELAQAIDAKTCIILVESVERPSQGCKGLGEAMGQTVSHCVSIFLRRGEHKGYREIYYFLERNKEGYPFALTFFVKPS